MSLVLCSFGIVVFIVLNFVIFCLFIKIVVGVFLVFIIIDFYFYSGCGYCGVVVFDELSCLKFRVDFVLIVYVLVSFFYIFVDLLLVFCRIWDFGCNGDVVICFWEGFRMLGFIWSGIDFCWKIIVEVECGVYFGWLWSCFFW